MSWRQIGESIKGGKTTALLYAGSVEQHGPHLPILTDTLLGYALGERVARKLGNALVAPVIRPGLSEHHIGFPGTLTFSFETFRRIVEEVCTSLAGHGFKNIIIISSHGGNTDTLKAVVPDIAKKLAGKSNVFFLIPDQRAHYEMMEKFRAKYKARLGEMGVHAGLSETSMLLAAHPELVEMNNAEEGLSDDWNYLQENVLVDQMDNFIRGIKAKVGNGVLGDPRRASVEIGNELLEATAEEQANRIQKIIKVLAKEQLLHI
ncbi:MAG: creatininase family protein [Thaumarchaeota archaeon]|nr:creatininase family protein [Nitrososphaerota archaeon]